MTRRVVITGMGGITAFGEDWPTISRRLREYENAVRTMTEWQAYDGLQTLLAAPIEDFTLPAHYTRKRIRAMGRVSLLSTRATELALEQAGLIDDAVLTNGQTGIAYGSSTGSTGPVSEFASMLTEKHTHNITGTTYVQMMPHTTAVNTGLFFGLRGRVIPTSSACTSGSQAIGYAWEAIRHGYQTVMVAGGAEKASTPLGVGGFGAARALSTRNDNPQAASRPWDKDRDGFVLGDGAGMVVLEEYEHAKKRGAKIYAEIVGFGMSSDAYHMTSPPEDGAGAALAMVNAIRDAGIEPSQIGYVNAHGTSTPAGDKAEAQAVKSVFGDAASRVLVSSTKSMTGHLLGAAGAVESIYSILALRDQAVPPTINLDNPDEGCDLDFVPHEARQVSGMEYTLCNSFGFGGTNGSLIFKKV